GEGGTGKELVAKAIHANSPRSDKAFVVVNSGSLPPDLLESNLFGHVKGAFTGAVYAKKGLFELADKGTLFFDEIGNIPLEKYAKENDKPVAGVSPEALQALMDYDWPGNVRELENVIERGVVLTTEPRIGRELIPDHVRTAPSFHVPNMTVPPEGISLKDVV